MYISHAVLPPNYKIIINFKSVLSFSDREGFSMYPCLISNSQWSACVLGVKACSIYLAIINLLLISYWDLFNALLLKHIDKDLCQTDCLLLLVYYFKITDLMSMSFILTLFYLFSLNIGFKWGIAFEQRDEIETFLYGKQSWEKHKQYYLSIRF